MKSKLHLFALLFALVALSVGCAGDGTSFDPIEDSSGIDPDSKGYLSLSSMSLVVETLDETYGDSGSDSVDGLVAITRATIDIDSEDEDDEDEDEDEEDDTEDVYVPVLIEDYIVKISNMSTGESIYDGTYADVLKNSVFVLSAGRYLVEVMSCESNKILDAGWECPAYYGSQECVVGNSNTTTVGEVVCTLANVKVSVDMSVDLIDMFKAEEDCTEDGDLPMRVTLTAGGESLVFDPANPTGLYGYFAAPADEIILVSLTGMYYTGVDELGEPTYFAINEGDWDDSVTGVKAGQYRSISVKIDYNEEGGLGLKVETTTWTYDETITVSVTSTKFLSLGLSEDVIADPDDVANAPMVTLADGLSIDEIFTIKDSMIDTDTKTYSPTYKVYITPQGDDATLKSISIKLSSTAQNLMSALSAVGFESDNSITIYDNGEPALSLLSDYISLRNSDLSSQVVAALTYEGAYGLYQYLGVHEVEVTATDSQGRSSVTTLSLASVNDSLPVIEWLGDYNFETTYNIYTDSEITASAETESPLSNPTIEIAISSGHYAGINSMVFKIVSDVLSDDLLKDVGLSATMDLIGDDEDESDDELLENIAGLGLPVGDQVKGQNYLELDVTVFLPLLAALGDGESSFVITVGDASGTSEQTVNLIKE